jgi:hypothetical protein
VRHLQQSRGTFANAAIALIVLVALAPVPVAIVVETISLLPIETIAIAPVEQPGAQLQSVALLALALLRAPPIA